ncbi:MAG: hypothetical protein R2867_31010 [Caldilineaceae bacterium]
MLANSLAQDPFSARQQALSSRRRRATRCLLWRWCAMRWSGARLTSGLWAQPVTARRTICHGGAADPRRVSPKVRGLIQARLAELSSTAREIAVTAATIGRVFSYAVLAGAIAHTEEALVQSLDELCQRRIVRERSADLYEFTHDKLREVTYNSASAARRRLAHKTVAQSLEQLSRQLSLGGRKPIADPPQLVASGQIANHYELAGLSDKAVHYYQQAAVAAHQLSANQDAVRDYRSAIAPLNSTATPDAAVAMELHEQLGDLLCMLGDYAEARANFAQALMQVLPTTTLLCARLHRKVGSTWREEYHYAQAMQFYNAALRALLNPVTPPQEGAPSAQPWVPAAGAPAVARPERESHSPTWWAEWLQIQLEIDLVHYWLAETEASMQLHHELAPLIEEHGTVGQRATFCQRRAQLELRRHRSIATADAVAYARRALLLYKEAAMPEQLPAAHFMLGFTALWQGDLATAEAELQETRQLATQSGDRSLQARVLTYLTIVARLRGAVTATEQLATQALAIAGDVHMPEYIALAQANQAWVAWQQHDLVAVREHGHAAQALWQQLPVTHASAPFQWTALWPLLAVALVEEELDGALTCVHALLDPNQQQLPERLVVPLTAAVRAGANNEAHAALHHMQAALHAAQELHYL